MTQVHYGRGQASVGDLWVAWTEKGLCALRLARGTPLATLQSELQRLIPSAELVKDANGAGEWLDKVNAFLMGKLPSSSFSLDLCGTAFQQRVWRELCQIPRGQTWAYQEVARRIGRPTAVRAVASACARNPIALIVPCHRVVRSDGGLGGYFWGTAIKQKLLRLEGVEV